MDDDKRMPWTRAESETVIRRNGDSNEWDCYSCIRRDVTKLRRIAQTHEREVREIDHWSIRVTLPYAAISFRNKSKRAGINPFANLQNKPDSEDFEEEPMPNDDEQVPF